MAKPSNRFSETKTLKKEILAILLLALIVFIFLSLVSYSASDPSLNTLRIKGAQIHNYCGIVGSYLADTFFHSIGLSAYLIPLVLILMLINIMYSESIKIGFMRISGFLLFIISSSGLFALFYKGVPFVKSGGLIGYFIGKMTSPYISEAGSFLVLFTILCVSIVLATQISLVYLAELLKELFIWLSKGSSYIKAVLIFVYRKLEELFDNLLTKSEEAIEEGIEDIKYNREEPGLPKPILKEKTPLIPIKERIVLKKSSKKRHANKHDFKLPSIELLNSSVEENTPVNKDELFRNSRILENKLKDFGVYGRVVEVEPGPIITMYEFEPAPGVKLNKITRLADDLAMALKALSIRIVAPIPGKAVVGIEIPNKNRETVFLRDIIENDSFETASSMLAVCMGKNTSGLPVVTDLRKMPHLLVAGATGTGKSVFVNSIIMSILYKATPSEGEVHYGGS